MMRNPIRYSAVLALWITLAQAALAAPPLRDFDAKSIDAIRGANAGRPFILAFWSIHCEPCLRELSQWGPLQRRHPDIRFILVATDGAAERTKVSEVLARYDVAGVQTWAFADALEERVRFAVDRTWRGELPRTYLYDRSHRFVAHSGLLDPGWLDGWLDAEKARAGSRPEAPTRRAN
jgi:hypothetical protein